MFQKNCAFPNPLHPIPRLHIAARNLPARNLSVQQKSLSVQSLLLLFGRFLNDQDEQPRLQNTEHNPQYFRM